MLAGRVLATTIPPANPVALVVHCGHGCRGSGAKRAAVYRHAEPYGRFNQVGFVAGDGAKWTPAPADGWARGAFQSVGSVKIRQHRPVPGTVKFLRLKREHRRWYVIVITDTGAEPLPATGRSVGADLGIARFLTTSDGEIIANPRFLAVSAETIARLQQRKEHARRGSGNRKRLRRALAKEWRKVRNRRRDFHHKTARALVDTCDVIALEKLNPAGMTRRPAPKPDPGKPGAFLPNMASAKAGLNKAILDAGWAQFASILTAKAESAGRRVLFVNPAGTSITCHICGRECTRPRRDTVTCPTHGKIDADINGARNIAARPGWALVKPPRLEKPVPLNIGAVTGQANHAARPATRQHRPPPPGQARRPDESTARPESSLRPQPDVRR